MNRADFQTLFTYSDNCWRLLDTTLQAAPNAWEASFETTSRWNSIRLLLAHSIAAEERLVRLRLQNIALPVPYEDRAALDWSQLYQDHRAIRASTYTYLASLTDAELEDINPVMPSTSERGARTRADLLFQIINHENYHRGEVIMTLQRLGIDPPNFDYMVLKD